jgi:predicted nicotinamide N-methyase
MMEETTVDDEDYDYEFLKSMFANGKESEDDGSHRDVSEHTWTCEGVSVIYHLALLAPGHGDSVWNSSKCIAQHLLSPQMRSELFGTTVQERLSWPPRSALEFGAGAALPSMILLKERTGTLVCTDRKINEQTFDALIMSVQKNSKQWGLSQEEVESRVHVMPHTWGEEIETLKEPAGEIELLIASDCIYDPTYHKALLQSASGSMSKETGLFVVGYSYHMNVPPEKVIKFFEVAKSMFGLSAVSEFKKDYEGQIGIGNKDPNRGAVYVKVLAHQDSIYFQ